MVDHRRACGRWTPDELHKPHREEPETERSRERKESVAGVVRPPWDLAGCGELDGRRGATSSGEWQGPTPCQGGEQPAPLGRPIVGAAVGAPVG